MTAEEGAAAAADWTVGATAPTGDSGALPGPLDWTGLMLLECLLCSHGGSGGFESASARQPPARPPAGAPLLGA